MRRTTSATLGLVLAMSLAACSQDDPAPDPSTSSSAPEESANSPEESPSSSDASPSPSESTDAPSPSESTPDPTGPSATTTTPKHPSPTTEPGPDPSPTTEPTAPSPSDEPSSPAPTDVPSPTAPTSPPTSPTDPRPTLDPSSTISVTPVPSLEELDRHNQGERSVYLEKVQGRTITVRERTFPDDCTDSCDPVAGKRQTLTVSPGATGFLTVVPKVTDSYPTGMALLEVPGDLALQVCAASLTDEGDLLGLLETWDAEHSDTRLALPTVDEVLPCGVAGIDVAPDGRTVTRIGSQFAA
ncbi:hypothetical protein ACFFHC_01640 [Kytococcus schroeteri]|uniref:hypothetical protein n=2 Tax=Kytococcus schroeteri TaxID=138300 RepID=UPI0035ED6B5D